MLYSPDGFRAARRRAVGRAVRPCCNTGDERWLERARRFAVRALGQAERRRAELRVGRYSLFTGDAGVALFAAVGIEADARLPISDRI